MSTGRVGTTNAPDSRTCRRIEKFLVNCLVAPEYYVARYGQHSIFRQHSDLRSHPGVEPTNPTRMERRTHARGGQSSSAKADRSRWSIGARRVERARDPGASIRPGPGGRTGTAARPTHPARGGAVPQPRHQNASSRGRGELPGPDRKREHRDRAPRPVHRNFGGG